MAKKVVINRDYFIIIILKLKSRNKFNLRFYNRI